eukprot:8926661-Ditylum_brightwellii.AAC.1
MTESGTENAISFQDKKYQGGKTLPFLDHNFTGYYTTEWYQWEVNVQLLAKGATQLNLKNDFGEKSKNFPKAAKEVIYLLHYNVINGCNKNFTMILHATGLISFGQFKNRLVVSHKECLKLVRNCFKSPQHWFAGVLLHIIYASLLVLMANSITKMVLRSKNKSSREQKWCRKTKF